MVAPIPQVNCDEVRSKDFSDALRKLRDQSRASSALPPPPTHPLRDQRRQRIRIAMTILVVVFGATAWWFVARGVQVRGLVVDPWGQHIQNALVFVASSPAIRTTTDEKGRFKLGGIPPGKQILVVVVEEQGEEYLVQGHRGDSIDLGRILCSVPPLAIRRGPGGGSDYALPKNEFPKE